MAGYSGSPLWKKLGVRAGATVTTIDAPPDWGIPHLPDGAGIRSETAKRNEQTPAELIVAFFTELSDLRASVPGLGRRIFPSGAVWFAWPRRAGGHDSDIREGDIRELALPLGLVDVKVAALDEDWSALKLLWRRELRQAPKATDG
jgi:hypothetical protein